MLKIKPVVAEGALSAAGFIFTAAVCEQGVHSTDSSTPENVSITGITLFSQIFLWDKTQGG